jgi:hypothetical protein
MKRSNSTGAEHSPRAPIDHGTPLFALQGVTRIWPPTTWLPMLSAFAVCAPSIATLRAQ